jgi:hypothetical protein
MAESRWPLGWIRAASSRSHPNRRRAPVLSARGGGDGGVRVLRADDGRPELVGSGVESDDAEPGVQRAGGSGEEHERGVVDGAGRLIPDVRRTM